MNFEDLKKEIEQVARFESLVHLPEKPRDRDWPIYVARAVRSGESFSGEGNTDLEAMRALLIKLRS